MSSYFFSFIYPDENNPKSVDDQPLVLDKAWHVAHFILTGDTSLNLLKSGTQVIDVVDATLEFHPSDAVAELWLSVEGKSADDLFRGLTAAQLNQMGIYDEYWVETDIPYLLEKLTGFLQKIRVAATSNKGLFVSIT